MSLYNFLSFEALIKISRFLLFSKSMFCQPFSQARYHDETSSSTFNISKTAIDKLNTNFLMFDFAEILLGKL